MTRRPWMLIMFGCQALPGPVQPKNLLIGAKMTKRVLFCLALAAMLMCTMAAFAQDAPPAGQGQGRGQGGGRPMMTPDERVTQMDKDLTLTADQKTKLKAIF